MLQKDKPYGEVIGMPGVSFEQNGQLFNKKGIGVDDKGNAIESTPKIELPPIDTNERDAIAESEPETSPEDPSSTMIDLIDRIKIEGPSVKGYMPKKEIKEWLDMYNVSYTNFQSRKILAGLLKKELGL